MIKRPRTPATIGGLGLGLPYVVVDLDTEFWLLFCVRPIRGWNRVLKLRSKQSLS